VHRLSGYLSDYQKFGAPELLKYAVFSDYTPIYRFTPEPLFAAAAAIAPGNEYFFALNPLKL
jgi:hypothetical protein